MKREKKRCRVTLDDDSCKKSKADTTDTSVWREKEIYNFNRNSYREIGNDNTFSISLHPTRNLVALCSPFGLHCLLEIYTLDGLLVTSIYHDWQSNNWTTMTHIHFTDDMIVLFGLGAQTIRYNDYNTKQKWSLIIAGFDCDKDGFIYTPIFNENAIAIYSHDLEYLEKFDAYNSDYGEVISIRIRKDTMVILSALYILNNEDRFTIQRYDLSKKIILQTVKLNLNFMSDPKYLCLDPLDNVIISNNSPDKLAVWYSGGRVRYYRPKDGAKLRFLGFAMTEDFQMFRCIQFGHKLRVYEPK